MNAAHSGYLIDLIDWYEGRPKALMEAVRGTLLEFGIAFDLGIGLEGRQVIKIQPSFRAARLNKFAAQVERCGGACIMYADGQAGSPETSVVGGGFSTIYAPAAFLVDPKRLHHGLYASAVATLNHRLLLRTSLVGPGDSITFKAGHILAGLFPKIDKPAMLDRVSQLRWLAMELAYGESSPPTESSRRVNKIYRLDARRLSSQLVSIAETVRDAAVERLRLNQVSSLFNGTLTSFAGRDLWRIEFQHQLIADLLFIAVAPMTPPDAIRQAIERRSLDEVSVFGLVVESALSLQIEVAQQEHISQRTMTLMHASWRALRRHFKMIWQTGTL